MRPAAHGIGRFGWKAEQPTVRQQAAGAFVGDIGITSPLFRDENCTRRGDRVPRGADRRRRRRSSDKCSRRSRSTRAARGAGARATWTIRRCVRAASAVRRGRLRDLPHADAADRRRRRSLPVLAGQTIHPYTDLLLHDMGDGLADGRPEFLATGSEWRTPPLWGLGLVAKVNGHTFLLHDGRARGSPRPSSGTAAKRQARETIPGDAARDRAALLAFLDSR